MEALAAQAAAEALAAAVSVVSAAAEAVASVEAAAAVLAEAAVAEASAEAAAAALAVGAEKLQGHLTGQKARRIEPTCFFCLREIKKRRSKAFFAPAWCR